MGNQLLSTLTQKKVWILFFLTLLSVKGSKAGQAFKNCLKYEMFNDNSYENLLKCKFPLSIGIFSVCFDKSQCYQWNEGRCGTSGFYFACTESTNPGSKEYIFCGTWALGQTRLLKRCGGIVGEALITTRIVKGESFCTNRNINLDIIPKMDKYLATSATLVGLEQGYASWNCPNDACGDFDACVWDNSGWTCFNSGCHLQWPAPWPGHADTNPYRTIATVTSTTTPSMSIKPMLPPESDDHLLEKILIPIGVITGTSLVGGMTYYYYKKRRRMNDGQQIEVSNDSRIEEIELAGNSEVRYRNPHTNDDYSEITEERRNPQEIGL